MTISLQRATDLAGVAAFDQVTYVGDQPWDLAATQALGFQFVGVRVDGDMDRLRAAGAETGDLTGA